MSSITIGRGATLNGPGTFNLSSGTLTLKNEQIQQAWLPVLTDQVHPISMFAGRVWDDLSEPLPSAAATDDLGLIDGAVWGTNAPTMQTIDQDSNGSATASYARFLVPVPQNWKSGESLSIRVVGGMVTTVSDTTATVDVEVYSPDGDGSVGADLCATAAQTINGGLLSAGGTTCDFTLTTTSLAVGNELDIRLAVTIEDGATGTAVIGAVSQIGFLVDTQG